MLRLRRHKTVNDPVAVVNRFVDAANRHDADGIARCLHPDFESIQPVYPARNFRGADQVKRNWQAIFQSEPGFRLTLVRASANEGTVWVELNGAGSNIEVAGVFIMGVEDNLVKWARVYSAVVEQPPAEVAPPAESAVARTVPPTPQAEAEELRRVIGARRVPSLADDPTGEDTAGDETPAAAASTTVDASGAEEAGAAEDAGDPDGVGKSEVAAAGTDDSDATPTATAEASSQSAEGEDAEPAAEQESLDDLVTPEASGSDVLPVAENGGIAQEDEAPDVAEVAETTEAGGVSDADEVSGAAAVAEAAEEPPPPSGPAEAEQELAGDAAPEEKPDGDESGDAKVSPELSAVVGEVQALAEPMRPSRSKNRSRKPGGGDRDGDEGSGSAQGGDNIVELDDAARVRAAARAATSKAAGLTSNDARDSEGGRRQGSPGDGPPRKRSRPRRPPRKT